MKKLIIFGLVLTIITGCSNKNNCTDYEDKINKLEKEIKDLKTEIEELQKQEDESNDKDNQTGVLEEINFSQFLEEYKKNEAQMFYFGRPTCPNCTAFKPVLEEFVSDAKIKVFYIDTDKLTDYAALDKIVHFTYVPSIIIIKNKEILFNSDAVRTKERLQELVTEYKIK